MLRMATKRLHVVSSASLNVFKECSQSSDSRTAQQSAEWPGGIQTLPHARIHATNHNRSGKCRNVKPRGKTETTGSAGRRASDQRLREGLGGEEARRNSSITSSNSETSSKRR